MQQCSVSWCDRPSLRQKRTTTGPYAGLCQGHYQRRYLGTDMDKPWPPRIERGCSILGCDGEHSAKGLCFFHYNRQYVPGERSKNGYGDKRLGSNGYTEVWMPDHPNAVRGWLLEHRWVMEQQVGRTLSRDESVHHRNGITTDNRPENLELWASVHPSGQRVSDLVAFAQEVLERYG